MIHIQLADPSLLGFAALAWRFEARRSRPSWSRAKLRAAARLGFRRAKVSQNRESLMPCALPQNQVERLPHPPSAYQGKDLGMLLLNCLVVLSFSLFVWCCDVNAGRTTALVYFFGWCTFRFWEGLFFPESLLCRRSADLHVRPTSWQGPICE